MAESGTAPSRGSTMPPIMAAGSPRSSNNSAPSDKILDDINNQAMSDSPTHSSSPRVVLSLSVDMSFLDAVYN